MEFSSLLSLGGLTICGLVLLQLVGLVTRSIQDHFFRLRRFQSSQRLLEAKILAAKRGLLFPSKDALAWSGTRKFRVKWKIAECNHCHSFYLVPHDGKPLAPFRPGQYITLSARLPGSDRATIRCYSLSDAPRQDYYRITVKKIAAAGDELSGRFSSFMNDVVSEADILDIKSPRGSFFLDTDSDRPVVLLAAGIGVTPMICMLTYVVQCQPNREVYVFMSARNSAEHPFKKQLASFATEHALVHLRTIYSDPLPADKLGKDFDINGRVHIGQIRNTLPSSNFDYYLCGPSSFMFTISEGLRAWGVPKERIKSEAFGPESVKLHSTASIAPVLDSAATQSARITFTRSNKTVDWSDDLDTLLDLAEAHDIEIESGCRAGSCGTCLTAVKSGRIINSTTPGCEVEEGTCLPCIAVPDGDVTLDA